jgi:hypothetical protein
VREGKKGTELTLTGKWTRALWAEIRAEWDEKNCDRVMKLCLRLQGSGRACTYRRKLGGCGFGIWRRNARGWLWSFWPGIRPALDLFGGDDDSDLNMCRDEGEADEPADKDGDGYVA